MTLFDVRIPGLKMTVVAADGQPVQPVTVDEFRIGNAETYDVLVTPADDRAYTIFAQSMDRTGFARGTLAPRAGMAADVPAPDARVLLTMADMGHGDDGAHAGHDMAAMAGHEGHTMPPPAASPPPIRHAPAEFGPFVDMRAGNPLAPARRSRRRPAGQRPARAHLRRSRERPAGSRTAASRRAPSSCT